MVVVPAEFSEMVTASDLVVHGRVIAIRPQIAGNRRTIETVITGRGGRCAQGTARGDGSCRAVRSAATVD